MIGTGDYGGRCLHHLVDPQRRAKEDNHTDNRHGNLVGTREVAELVEEHFCGITRKHEGSYQRDPNEGENLWDDTQQCSERSQKLRDNCVRRACCRKEKDGEAQR